MKKLYSIAEQAMQNKYKLAIAFYMLLALGTNFLLYSFFKVEQYKNYVRFAIIGILAIHCLMRFVTKNLSVKSCALCVLAAFLVLMNGQIAFNLAFLLLAVVLLQSIHLKQLYNCAAFVSKILLMCVLLALTLGVVDNYAYSVSHRLRMTLGFTNVNGTSMFAFSLIIILFLAEWKKNANRMMPFAAMVMIVYILTDTRTMILSACVLAIAWLLLGRLPGKAERVAVFVVTVLMFLAPFFWGISSLSTGKLNEIMSLRPELYLRYIQSNSLLNFLFGGSKAAEMDNSYLLILYNGGIFVYMAITLVTVIAMDAMVRAKRYADVCFCLAMLTYGQLEGTLVRPEILCTPVFWACVVKNFSYKNFKETVGSVRCYFKCLRMKIGDCRKAQ